MTTIPFVDEAGVLVYDDRDGRRRARLLPAPRPVTVDELKRAARAIELLEQAGAPAVVLEPLREAWALVLVEWMQRHRAALHRVIASLDDRRRPGIASALEFAQRSFPPAPAPRRRRIIGGGAR